MKTICREGIEVQTLELLRRHAAKLNRQIVRTGLDLPGVVVRVTNEYSRRINDRGALQQLFDVEIDAPEVESIVRPGYELIALAQSAIDGEDVQRADHRIMVRIGDESVDLSPYRSQALTCDECHTRRQRNTVMILRETATGRLFCVGTDCAELYVPSAASCVNILQGLTFIQEEIFEVDDDGEGEDPYAKSRAANLFDRDSVLRIAWIWTAVHGFVKADEVNSTKDAVGAVLGLDEDYNREYERLAADSDIASVDRQIAAMREWVESKSRCGDYFDNLCAALSGGPITRRTLGLAVSAPAVYRRHLEKQRKAESSAHFGTPGKRFGIVRKAQKWRAIDLAARPVGQVLSCRGFDGYWGTRYKVAIQLETGELLVWWTNTYIGDELVGEKVGVTATVKDHGLHRGEKETVISRAVLEPMAVAA